MAFHVITARLNGTPGDGAVLEAALSLAKAESGHVRALFCRPDPRVVAAAVYDGIYAGYYDDLVSTMEREWTVLANKSLKKYESWKAAHKVRNAQGPNGGKGPSSEWREVKGNEAAIIRRLGGVSDAIVVAMPARRIEDPYDAGFEAALLDSGRPVLLVPQGKPVVAEGAKVIIAWNGSAEAARAVAAAMPVLHQAAQITVFTEAEGSVEAGMAEDLVDYLKWHGIAATVLDGEAVDGPAVEERLRKAARKAGANLLVMGAYTHNRWREAIFGGVTRHMFSHAELPVLMAH